MHISSTTFLSLGHFSLPSLGFAFAPHPAEKAFSDTANGILMYCNQAAELTLQEQGKASHVPVCRAGVNNKYYYYLLVVVALVILQKAGTFNLKRKADVTCSPRVHTRRSSLRWPDAVQRKLTKLTNQFFFPLPYSLYSLRFFFFYTVFFESSRFS